MCRENGIDHILTRPRSPTTTGKIERFLRTLRTEFLIGLVFDSLEEAQTRVDAWVRSYNEQRPHSALDMNTPVSRFQSNQWQRPVDVLGLAAHGMISVSNQPVSVGKHRAGRRVDVRLQESALQIWDGDELIKTVLRTITGEVRKKKGDHRESKVA